MDSNQSVSLSQTQQTPQPPPPVAPVTEEDQDEVFSSKSIKTSSSGGGEIDSSSSSVSSFVSEEAFMSGDDEFETASERPFVADEENLELAMGEGEDMVVTGGGVDDEIDLGPLNFPPLVPSSLASGGGNEVVGGDGVEVEKDGVEVGKVRVLEGEVGELGVKERELGGSSVIGDGVFGDDGVVNDDVKMVGDDSLVVNPENGVLGFEENGVSLVENPVSDKVSTEVHEDVSKDKEDILDKNLKLNEVVNPVVVSGEEEVAEVKDEVVEDKKSDFPELVESVGDEAIAEVEGFSEASAEKKDDVLPNNSKLGEVVNPESQKKETTELKDGVVEEEKSETVDLGVELAEDKVVGVTEGSVVAVDEGSVLPEKLKQEEVVNLVNGSQEEETTVLEDGIVVEETKSESLDSGLIEAVGDKVPVIAEGSSELEISKLTEERKSEILDVGSIEVVGDKVPVVDEDSSRLEVSNLTAVVDPAISSQEEEKIKLKDSAVQDEKDEVLGGELTANSMLGEDSVTDTKQRIEVSEHVDSDINEVELPIEKGATLASNGKQGENVVEELTYSKVVEVDNEVNLTKADSDVETKQPITSEVEANGIGGIQDKIIPETPALAVDRSADVSIVSDQVPAAVEEYKDPKFVEADTGFEKVEHNESETELGNVETADELNGSGSAESASVHPDGKPELEAAPEIDSGANLIESKSELAAEGVEYEAPDAVTCTKSEDLKTAPEIDSETNLTEPKSELADGAAQVVPAAVTCTKSEELKTDPEIDSGSNRMPESPSTTKTMDQEAIEEAKGEVNLHPDFEEDEGSVSDEDNEGLMFDGSEAARQIMKELMQGSVVNSRSAAQDSQDDSERIDGQIIAESDEEMETDEEDDGKELFDSAALSALLKAATGGGSEGGTVTITSPDGSRLFSVERPAGLGSSVRPLRPAPRPTRPNIFTPSDLTVGGASENNLSEEEKKKLEKIQLIRVKYLRLIHRLGHSPDDSIVAQVLYRLVLTAGRNTSEAFSPETAKKTAMQLESEGKDDLDFCLNILVLGKTGVGKSATINSIFGEEKTTIDAFQPATTTVKEIVGTVGGVKIRVFDTPGLRSSAMEQAFNRKILSSVKKATKKCPPDILLYVDRLDTQTRDLNDLPLLRSITNTLGSSIWRSAVVTLTHGASAPPDGPSGNPLSYEVFVAQRSHVVQQSIGQAVGDLRMMNPSLMNPVTLVENHPSCRKNREGQKILPNGQSWRPQLLLLSYSLKILSEVNSLSKPQDPFDHRKLFGFRVRSPPLPYLLSTLLQSRTHPKLPTDQGGENVDSDIELEDLSDSDQEDEEDEYDQLPPFKPLRKAQIAKLSREQRKAYFDEYDYRVKLLQKKQWKEELRRMKEMKNGKNDAEFMGEDADPDGGAAAPVPVPLPDMVLPPSFDGDNPAYRYRFLEPTSQLLARPVLDTHGWDHDCGYDGVSLEENLAIAGRFPAAVAVQITKDKKEFNIHLDSSVAAKHGENGSTLAGFDIQTIGKHLAYVFRGETKFKKLKRNKMAGGISVTFLGESVATGLKFEDQISIGKRVTLVGSTGTVRSQGDAAYGANLEARLKEKDFPIGQDQSTLGLSLMKWRGDLALGANLQSQFSIGRSSKLSVRVGLNNKLSGQITVRISSSEQLQLALVGILPIALSIYRTIWPETGETYSAY